MRMSKKQLVSLFICSLVPYTLGLGLLPILPVYATKMGAGPAVIGYYLAFAFLFLAIGAITAGWLSDKLQGRKKILVTAGVLLIPVVWFMGVASNIWQLAILTAIVWFLGGMEIPLVYTLTGLFAEEDRRGKIFGIIRLTMGLGFVIGGLTCGPIVDQWGYPTLFKVLALFCVILPLTGMLLEDKVVAKSPTDKLSPAKDRTKLTGGIFLLLIAVAIFQISGHAGNMGRSLIMNEKGFTAAAISSTAAVEGVISIPLFLLLGWLSDTVGRKRLIGLCYFTYSIGMLVLAGSVSLWQFYVFSSLRALINVSIGVGSALVTDLVPKESLGRGMSLFQGASWGAGIIGLSCAGYAFQRLGMTSSVILFAFLPLIAIILLIPIREKKERLIQKR
jgi:DHA1 family multidrug resistance protein-like MFS transporter